MSKQNILGGTPHFVAKVTPKIVDRGVARNSNHCMIAEAVKEAYPRLSRISVDIQTIRASNPKKGERYVWLTPRSVQKSIIDFDRGVKPKPFAFHLTSGQTVAVRQKTPAEKKAMRNYYHEHIKPAKARVSLTRQGKKSGSVPDVRGGKTPPTGVGARRSFGLRSLQY